MIIFVCYLFNFFLKLKKNRIAFADCKNMQTVQSNIHLNQYSSFNSLCEIPELDFITIVT